MPKPPNRVHRASGVPVTRAEAALHPRKVVNYELTRRLTLSDLRTGTVSVKDVCDADEYLLRAATFHGHSSTMPCPICRKETVTWVNWVFGDSLPGESGSARSDEEIKRLALTRGEFTVHVVEVCRSCAWNFLVQSYDVGLAQASTPPRHRRQIGAGGGVVDNETTSQGSHS